MYYKNKSFLTKKKAFTLIELLIVIAIIGILFIVLVSKVDFATDKAKATGVQTDFRSFQLAFDTVAKENAGFNTFGWDTGDTNGDGVRNSYDEGDANHDGKKDSGEVWTGHKVYNETWTGVYTLVKPGTTNYDADAVFALESAINKNLDPKLHITIGTDGTITMANQAQDPWKTEYHGVYLTNAANDGKDRGALIIYSNGANQEFGSEHSIANGIVTITVPGNNVKGQDDMSIVSCYTYVNGYGEVKNMTTGFSNNQNFLSGNNASNNLVNDSNDNINNDETICLSTFEDGTKLLWEDLMLEENGQKYGYNASKISQDTIDDYAFKDCTSLVSITIPEGITYIGYESFRGCSALTNISLPSSLENINSYVFVGCASLETVDFSKCTELRRIGMYSFYNCAKLKNVDLSNCISLIEINREVFTGTAIESLNLVNCTKLITISSSAFSNCHSLKDVTMPDGVKTIEAAAFYNCSSLQSIDLSHCTQLTNFGYNVFKDCTVLNTVVLPCNITTIDRGVFYNCTSLERVVIYSNVQTIVKDAFYNCTSLSNIVFNGTIAQWNALSKDPSWNSELPEYTIHCIDGDIAKDGTITTM